jgi:hypothetical protein
MKRPAMPETLQPSPPNSLGGGFRLHKHRLVLALAIGCGATPAHAEMRSFSLKERLPRHA